MNLIRASLERPVAVISVVIMVVLFGYVALQTIPIQLIPDVRKPTLTIQTIWFGASPAEVEREVINRQEDALRGLEGVEQITSSAETGRATVTLEFVVGQNIDRALILVSNRLQRVTGYPVEVQQPQIKTQGSDDNPIAWFYIHRLKGNKRPIHTYGDFIEDNVIDRMERVSGVSGTNFYGGSERELRVIVEPQRMARYGLTVSAVLDALRRANAFGSAGNVEEGKRSYLVRTEGELRTTKAVRAILLRSIEDKTTGRVSRVTVGDIANVTFGYKIPTATIRANGEPAVVFNVLRTTGANVIEVMRGVKATLKQINEEVLKPQGLEAIQVFDETGYINSAISLVQQNIFVGGALAALILLLFLRSGRATLVVTLAIPVSVIGSFVAMAALGRSVNVISLAGIAFAVGMVVDAAIVVLENIFRLRERGLSSFEAAYQGANQVWGAVLVSALTTVMVFIPILILELEVGQLFRDIAVAISVAVLLSLVVAVTLIPALANRLLGQTSGETTIDPKSAIDGSARKAGAAVKGGVKRLRLPIIDDFAELFMRVVLGFTRMVIRNRTAAFLVVALVCGAAGTATWLLLPKLEYLPTGNRNLVIAIALPPPGYNLPTTTETARNIENSMRKHWAQVTGPKSKPGEPPKMARFFFVARNALTFIGASAVDESRARELIPIIRAEMRRDPGTFARVFQPSLFGRSIGGGRVINLDIAGPNLERNLQVALRAFILASRELPLNQGNQFRPRPGLELGSPELRVLPNRVRLADAGVTARELTDTVDAYNQGLRVVEITVAGRRMDLTLMGPESKIKRIQGIGDIHPLAPGRRDPHLGAEDVQVRRRARPHAPLRDLEVLGQRIDLLVLDPEVLLQEVDAVEGGDGLEREAGRDEVHVLHRALPERAGLLDGRLAPSAVPQRVPEREVRVVVVGREERERLVVELEAGNRTDARVRARGDDVGRERGLPHLHPCLRRGNAVLRLLDRGMGLDHAPDRLIHREGVDDLLTGETARGEKERGGQESEHAFHGVDPSGSTRRVRIVYSTIPSRPVRLAERVRGGDAGRGPAGGRRGG